MKTFTLALPTSFVLHVSTHPTSVTNWRHNRIRTCLMPTRLLAAPRNKVYPVYLIFVGFGRPLGAKWLSKAVLLTPFGSPWGFFLVLSRPIGPFFLTHSYTGEIHPIRAPGSCSSLTVLAFTAPISTRIQEWASSSLANGQERLGGGLVRTHYLCPN